MSSGIYRSSHQSGYLRRPLVEAFDVVWPGEIMARAHHGGSACGNAETEGFAHLPADRDRKEHVGKEAVTGTNRAFRLDGGSWQEKRSGGDGKDRHVMAHSPGAMGGLAGSKKFEGPLGDF